MRALKRVNANRMFMVKWEREKCWVWLLKIWLNKLLRYGKVIFFLYYNFRSVKKSVITSYMSQSSFVHKKTSLTDSKKKLITTSFFNFFPIDPVGWPDWQQDSPGNLLLHPDAWRVHLAARLTDAGDCCYLLFVAYASVGETWAWIRWNGLKSSMMHATDFQKLI